VIGALLPAVLPIDFRLGVLLLGAFYLVVGISYLLWPQIERRRWAARTRPSEEGPTREPDRPA
jgi:hypothetical protein